MCFFGLKNDDETSKPKKETREKKYEDRRGKESVSPCLVFFRTDLPQPSRRINELHSGTHDITDSYLVEDRNVGLIVNALKNFLEKRKCAIHFEVLFRLIISAPNFCRTTLGFGPA